MNSGAPPKPALQLGKLSIWLTLIGVKLCQLALFEANNKYLDDFAIFLVTLLVLAGIMFFRWYNTGSIMPAGVIAFIATATLVINSVVYYQDLRNQLG